MVKALLVSVKEGYIVQVQSFTHEDFFFREYLQTASKVRKLVMLIITFLIIHI